MFNKIILAAVAAILVIIIYASFFKGRVVTYDAPTPTPTPSQTVDKQKIYMDQMTSKCYNEEEVEVACKG